MQQNNSFSQNNIKAKAKDVLKKAGKFFARWLFLISLIIIAAFCVFAWYRYIWKSEWDEAKKNQYISEQANFSFDKSGYQKTVELMKNREDKLQNFPRFTGRDVFSPEGF